MSAETAHQRGIVEFSGAIQRPLQRLHLLFRRIQAVRKRPQSQVRHAFARLGGSFHPREYTAAVSLLSTMFRLRAARLISPELKPGVLRRDLITDEDARTRSQSSNL